MTNVYYSLFVGLVTCKDFRMNEKNEKKKPFKNKRARKVIRVDPEAIRRIEIILLEEYGSVFGCWQAFAHKAIMNQLRIEEGTHKLETV